ncbi:MAG: B12-binding domain-containing radical SAM protein [Acidobacteriota bacterium]
MKVLFVNPYIYDFTAFDLWLRPVGNLYLAAIVEKYTNADIYWIDTLDRFQDDPAIKTGLYGKGKFHRSPVEKPPVYKDIPRTYARYGIPVDSFRKKLENLDEVDFIFVTTLMTYWIDGVNFTVKELKKRFKNARIVIGGILPSLIGKTINEYIDADIFISGYGEDQILDLLSSHGAVINSRPDFSDIDNIPFPLNRFLSNKKVLPLLTSRGCPYKCTYCASHILNKNFIQRSPEKIIEEIFFMNKNFGTEDFVIFDDAFLINKENRFFPVFENVSKSINIRFHTPNGIHAGEIDKNTAIVLYRSGFKTIRLSFESTDESILKLSSDKVSIDQMKIAVENLVNAGYKRNNIECYILFGLPGQSSKMLENSLLFTKELGILPRLSFFSPVPGTLEFNKLRAEGLLLEKDFLHRTNKLFFLYKYSGLNESEIKYFKDLTRDICTFSKNNEN